MEKKITYTMLTDEEMYFDEMEFKTILDDFGAILTGNRDYTEYGDEKSLKIIHHDYFDGEVGSNYKTLEMLEKHKGVKYCKRYINGYSQGDWDILYIPEKYNDKETIEYIEALVFGKYDIFRDVANYIDVKVPHTVVWEGAQAVKEFIEEQTGDNAKNIKLKIFKGYKKVPLYETV